MSELRVSPLFRATGAARSGESVSASSERERLKRACKELESVFWNQLLRAMRSTIQDGGLIGKGPGEGIFVEMLDQEYAGLISSSRTNGLAEQLYRQLVGGYEAMGGIKRGSEEDAGEL